MAHGSTIRMSENLNKRFFEAVLPFVWVGRLTSPIMTIVSANLLPFTLRIHQSHMLYVRVYFSLRLTRLHAFLCHASILSYSSSYASRVHISWHRGPINTTCQSDMGEIRYGLWVRLLYHAITILINTARLGAGAFARVHKCIERSTGIEYAVKIIDKSKLHRSHVDEQAVVREISILQRLADFRHVWLSTS